MTNQQVSGYVNGWGARKTTFWRHSGPASYASGGESLVALVLEMIDLAWVSPPSPAWTESGSYFISVSYPGLTSGVTASVTLKWYVVATGVEVANGVDLSGEVVRLLVIGT